ncbi:MAG TPA: UDP-N-acetylmuramoyl-L-alanine--D-glutamate ligase [Candidatus Bathyarchaeia archaeon]|nr:UDP-N-acetylmuramoyl-L-alanine--D-glutamate ligase [Candidatus Bathyarchaeia archaeon]
MTTKKPWLEKFIKDFRDKKVLILGLGVLGRGVADAKFFAQIGAKVTITDLQSEKELAPSLKILKNLPIKLVLGRHLKKDILDSDLILRNAAVPVNSPFLKLARLNKIPIFMDEALFAKYAPVKIIGITGTRGKSTTTALIFEILKEAKFSVWQGGNIKGKATLPLLERVNKDDWVVMELSSWQLQGFKKEKISPFISIITNIYEDHLNYYKNISDYIEDKKIIFKYQTKKDFLVLNKESSILRSFAKEAKSEIVWFSKKSCYSKWRLKILGEHNRLNAGAAYKVGEILGIDKKIIKKAFENFCTLPHRLELVAEIASVQYINDSTSTTPAAGIAALDTFQKPIILICGGSSKKLNMSAFAEKISRKVKKVLFLKGPETRNLANLVKKFNGCKKIAGYFNDLKVALAKAKSISESGDLVLLSPGCTSFGMFKNEFDRGEQFKKLVRKYGKKRLG